MWTPELGWHILRLSESSSSRMKSVYGPVAFTTHLAFMLNSLPATPAAVITWKCGNGSCIATWGRPKPRQSFSASITTPCQVWSRWIYPLLYWGIFPADTLLYAVTSTSDVTLTFDFDLWPWTFAVYCLWWDKSLYQIWTQSSYPWRSYIDLNIWHNEHVLSAALGSGIILTKFDLWQLIRAWIITVLVTFSTSSYIQFLWSSQENCLSCCRL